MTATFTFCRHFSSIYASWSFAHTVSCRTICSVIFSVLVFCQFTAHGQLKQIKKTKEKITTVGGDGGAVLIGDANSVTMTLDGRSFSGVLPFDVIFPIICTPGAADKVTFDEISGIDCWFDLKKEWPDLEKVKDDPAQFLNHHVSGTVDAAGKRFSFVIPELKHSKNYFFVFVIKRVLTVAQKRELVKALEGGLANAVSEVSKGGTKEISDTQFLALMDDAKRKASAVLAANGFKARFDLLPKDRYENMLDALQAISTDYARAATQRKSVVDAIENIHNWDTRLRDFEVSFEQNLADPALDSNVIALKAIFPLIPPVLVFPDGGDARDDNKVSNYLAARKALHDAVENVLPNNIKFAQLRADLTAYTEGLRIKYPLFVSRMKAIEAQNIAQTANFINATADILYSSAFISGTSTPGDFVTRSNLYLGLDLGVALIPNIGLLTPYMGTNIYLRPINKHHPLTRWQLDERFSFLVGISVTSLAKTGYRSDLLGGTFNLITGAGLRVSDFFRVNSGVAWYGQRAANPLNSNQAIGSSAFVSFSFDINVKTVLTTLFDPSKTALIREPK